MGLPIPDHPIMTPLRHARHHDGTVLLRSPLLESNGFPHAFSTAIGPGSAPFDLSRPGDSPLGTPRNTLEHAIRRFVEAVAPGATLATPRQVHGVAVASVDEAEACEADAAWSDLPGRLVGVRTADCVPILIACPTRNEVIAVHAGWRGLVADAPGLAVDHLRSRGSEPVGLVAAIGPAIGIDAFEIGEEVATEFIRAGLEATVERRVPRPHADLHQAARARLVEAGIPDRSIDGIPTCTVAAGGFHSHRRDGGRTGRHLAAIGPRDAGGSRGSDLGS